jgi:ABC-2 type transport system permease protein
MRARRAQGHDRLIANRSEYGHYAVELIRFALYGQLDWLSLAVLVGCTIAFLGGAIYAYNPSKGLIARRGGPGGG